MSDLDEHEQALKLHLEQIRDMKARMKVLIEGYAYCGPEDFVLRHGCWYRPTRWPRSQGAPKACFGNALMNAAMHDVPYIEGFSVPGMTFINGVPRPSLSVVKLPIHHAWNLDQNGELYDNTWMNMGLAYFGVQFSVGRADNATWFDDATVLDNPRNGHKLYRQPWTGENYNRVWRQSKMLKKVLRAKRRYLLDKPTSDMLV